MPILDEFGHPVQSKWRYAESAERSTRERPYQPVRLADIDKLIPPEDRKTLVSASNRLYANMPEIQGALDQICFYSVGRAYLPQFTGKDATFGLAAKEWLINEWYPIAEITGNDFRTAIFGAVLAMKRDGEAAIMLTETEDGYPQIQIIRPHRIGQRDNEEKKVASGPYVGLRITDGVITNRLGRPVAYRVLGEEPKDDKDVSARDLFLLFDKQYPEQKRGLPALSAALNQLRDSLTSRQWEQQALLMMSAFGIIEYNDDGGPDPSDPRNALGDGPGASCGINYETMAGGMVRYFRSNSGSKIQTIDHSRPGDAWSKFQERILKAALASLPWPYAMVMTSEGNAVATREELMRAQKCIDDVQDVIDAVAARCVGYAIAKAQKMGKLPQSPDWWNWKFSHPPKLTIDDGRTGKTTIDMYRSGFINHADFLEDRGKELEPHYYARAREIARRKQIAAEIGQEYGVEIDDREMTMLTPNEPKDDSSDTEAPNNSTPPENEAD